MARWKARVWLPIHHNWTFSQALCVDTLQGKTCQTSLLSGESGSLWAKMSGGRGRPSGIYLVSTKLDSFCYRTVQTSPCYVQSFWHNTGVWQTDGQTDGRTDGQTDGIAVSNTALSMRALRRAVKTVEWRERFGDIAYGQFVICYAKYVQVCRKYG